MCASKFLFSYKHQFILRYENCRAILYGAFRGVVVNFFLLTRLLIPLSVFRRWTAELPLEKADKIRNVFKTVFKGDVSNCS